MLANPNGLPNTQLVVACRGQASLPPKIPSPPKPGAVDVLNEEVPSWFEELLNEPESPSNRPHRRSASDPFAYLSATNMGGPYWSFRTPHGPNFVTRNPNHTHERDNMRKSGASSPLLPNGVTTPEDDADLKALGVSCITLEPDKVMSAANEGHNPGDGSENSSGGSDCSQMKPPSAPKPDAKRKQHNARRSRVRKLQYIAELERNAHALQMEGAEVAAQLEFLDQQNMILAMENRALKQRLESLSQEHFLKSLEQELLDRELARLQYLYHVQNVHQHQHRQRQKQAAAHRRGRSCDIESQFAKLHIQPPQVVAASNEFRQPQRN